MLQCKIRERGYYVEVKIVELRYDLDRKIPFNYGSKLRGFFANNFENVLFHNHDKNGDFVYSYPLIQYKIINNQPTLVGINQGAEVIVKNFLEIDEIVLGEKKFKNPSAKLEIHSIDLKVDNNRYKYEFHSPWMALNQKNFKKYLKVDDKKDFLKSKLIGNILSFAKGINWWIEKRIEIYDFNFYEIDVNYKNNKMLAFKCDFEINIQLPTNIGLGKSVSKGFGRIVQVD